MLFLSGAYPQSFVFVRRVGKVHPGPTLQVHSASYGVDVGLVLYGRRQVFFPNGTVPDLVEGRLVHGLLGLL